MIANYIKTSARSIMRNRFFSAINIAGLSISMTVGLLIIGMLIDTFQYDKFHVHHDRIYRVLTNYQRNNEHGPEYFATTSLKAAKTVKEFPGVEDATIIRRTFAGDMTHGEKTLPLTGFWTDNSFFSVFSFEIIEGNSATALKYPFSIVLTETSAKKFFEDKNPLGKVVTVSGRDYTVTAIMKDVPKFSHFKFDVLASLNSREITEKDNKNELAWDNIWETWIYLVIKDRTALETFQRNLDKLSKLEENTVPDTHITFATQPLDNIMAGENHSNQIGPIIGITPVWLLSGLALIVLLSACFNYTNLSLARSFKRSREIGIRKSVGAIKSQILTQVIVEAVIISLIALLIALGLFILTRPHFISLEGSLQELLSLDLSPLLLSSFFFFAILVGVGAGIVPALFFTRINAIQALKNLSVAPALKGLPWRKALIVVQYSISIIAICATVIIYRQYQHFISFDLGFNTANILNIEVRENRTAFMNKLMEMPEVKEISQSAMVSSIGNYWVENIKYKGNPTDSAEVFMNFIDEKYLPLHEFEFLSGRNFTFKPDSVEETEVIVNRHVLKRFNIAGQDSSEALGEIIRVGGKDLRIIGVLKDFEYGMVNNTTKKEVIMRYWPQRFSYLNVKLVSSDWLGTYTKIEAVWKRIDPVHPFDAKFYDDQIEEGFRGIKAAAKVGGFLAVLVIVIASVGLLGMVVFTTETRIKEVGIRKVLGASEMGLLILLAKGFIILLLISAAIGLPVTYIFFDQILLPRITNHISVPLPELFAGIAVILFLALIMIGLQTLKVARTNPAEVLKSE